MDTVAIFEVVVDRIAVIVIVVEAAVGEVVVDQVVIIISVLIIEVDI